MSTNSICLYKEVKKKYTGCNLKTMEFLDCALIGISAVIRSNMVLNINDWYKQKSCCMVCIDSKDLLVTQQLHALAEDIDDFSAAIYQTTDIAIVIFCSQTSICPSIHRLLVHTFE